MRERPRTDEGEPAHGRPARLPPWQPKRRSPWPPTVAVLADIATALSWDKSSVPDAQRRAETMLCLLPQGSTPSVYSGLLRPPGEDATDPGSPLRIAGIPAGTAVAAPASVICQSRATGRLAWLLALQTNENPPAEEARGVLSQSVARIKGERGAQFALAAGSGWKRADRWGVARWIRQGARRALEHVSFRWKQNRALSYCFVACCYAEPVSAFAGACSRAERDQKGRSTSSTCWP